MKLTIRHRETDHPAKCAHVEDDQQCHRPKGHGAYRAYCRVHKESYPEVHRPSKVYMSKRVSVNVTPKEFDIIKANARKKNMTISTLIMNAINAYGGLDGAP